MSYIMASYRGEDPNTQEESPSLQFSWTRVSDPAACSSYLLRLCGRYWLAKAWIFSNETQWTLEDCGSNIVARTTEFGMYEVAEVLHSFEEQLRKNVLPDELHGAGKYTLEAAPKEGALLPRLQRKLYDH